MARWHHLFPVVLSFVAGGCTSPAGSRPEVAPTGLEGTGSGGRSGAAEQAASPVDAPPLGSVLFVVQRAESALALLDVRSRRWLPWRIDGLGDMRHATMVFSPWLDAGFVASRDGQLSRIDLRTLRKQGERRTSNYSIDTAMAQDGRLVAVAEYRPGGLTLLDADDLEVVARFDAKDSRVTGVVDAPGGRFVATCMERGEVWVVDAVARPPRIARRVGLGRGDAYDAMITPDGRYYIVGHLGSDEVSVLDLDDPEAPVRSVSILPAELRDTRREVPVKLPHMAAWAKAAGRLFVPLVGRPLLSVLDAERMEVTASVPLRGNPVYAQASPDGRQVWVSFSGEADAWLQVVDARSLQVVDSLEVGDRIYHFEFVGRGATVAVSANGANQVLLLDAVRRTPLARLDLPSPSGVFGVRRAFRLGL